MTGRSKAQINAIVDNIEEQAHLLYIFAGLLHRALSGGRKFIRTVTSRVYICLHLRKQGTLPTTLVDGPVPAAQMPIIFVPVGPFEMADRG